jgi:hypothetical protein
VSGATFSALLVALWTGAESFQVCLFQEAHVFLYRVHLRPRRFVRLFPTLRSLRSGHYADSAVSVSRPRTSLPQRPRSDPTFSYH